jgi:penicillin-binding protein activator
MTLSLQATRYLLLAGLTLLPAACAQPIATTMIDPRADRSAIGMGLDTRDFEGAAAKVVQDMLASGAVDHPGGGRYVLVISRVTNDTMQRIDTDQLVKRIRVELLKSGKVVTTTALRVNGGPCGGSADRANSARGTLPAEGRWWRRN